MRVATVITYSQSQRLKLLCSMLLTQIDKDDMSPIVLAVDTEGFKYKIGNGPWSPGCADTVGTVKSWDDE